MPSKRMGLTPLRPNLDGNCFTIRTDHNALKWILRLNHNTVWLSQERLRLLVLCFNVVHRGGTKLPAAGALPRLLTMCQDKCLLKDELQLYVSDSVGSPHTAICTVAHNEAHPLDVLGSKFDPLSTVKLIRAQ